MNNKGFTLTEVVATVAILGVLFLTAIPNIATAVEKSKRNTYKNDALRMVAAAKAIYKKDTTIEEPTDTKCVIFTLRDLKLNDLNTGPYKGEYLSDYSFVTMNYSGGKYWYGVQLVEGVAMLDASKHKVVGADGKVQYRQIRGIKYYLYREDATPTLDVEQITSSLTGYTIIGNNMFKDIGGGTKIGCITGRITV